MRWCRAFKPRRKPQSEDRDPAYEEAQRRIANIKERGEKAAETLHARLRRNHWGETIAQIARREL